jgi:hypothetical protein
MKNKQRCSKKKNLNEESKKKLETFNATIKTKYLPLTKLRQIDASQARNHY